MNTSHDMGIEWARLALAECHELVEHSQRLIQDSAALIDLLNGNGGAHHEV